MTGDTRNVSTVFVADEEPRLTYHRFDGLHSTWDMEAVTLADARAMGAVECKHDECFGDSDDALYDFPYKDGEFL